MKIKGWELMKKIADGEIKKNQKIRMIFNDNSEVIFIFDGVDIINDTDIEIFDIYEIEEILRADFELIQDEIDIDSIEELGKTAYTEINLNTNTIIIKDIEFIDKETILVEKINELVQAVKQLNKKLEEK